MAVCRWMGFKSVVALVAMLALRAVFAQAPAPGGMAAPVVQEGPFKVQVPLERFVKGVPAEPGKPPLTPKQMALNGQREAQQFHNSCRAMMSNPGAVPLDRVRFEAFYVLYYFPMMTQTTPEALKDLPENRQRFFRDLENCKSDEAHQLLTGLTLKEMDKIVNDNFHPACRFNAVLMLGGLNDKEPTRVPQVVLPAPMARALPLLLTAFQSNKPEDDGVKLAALLGISRHLEWEPFPSPGRPIQADLRQKIISELINLAQMKDPPAHRDAEGHTWFRRRAVEALGLACAVKADPQIAGVLDGLLRDDKQPLALRLNVALAMGKMALPPNLDAKATATEMGYVALLACDTELNRLSKLKKDEEDHAIRLAGGLPGEFAGGMGGPARVGPRDNLGGGSPDGGSGIRPGAFPGSGVPGPGGLGGVRPAFPQPGFGGPGEGGGDPLDPNLLDPKGYRFEPVRRRLRYQLYCAQMGLLGGDDHAPPKTGAAPPPGKAATPTGSTTTPVPYGLFNAVKGPDQQFVDDMYAKVRKLADLVENRASDLAQLDRDMRREMKNLEAATRKIAAPVAPPAEAEEPLIAPPVPPAGPAAAPMPPAAAAPQPMPAGKAAPPPAAAPTPPPAAAAPMPAGKASP